MATTTARKPLARKPVEIPLEVRIEATAMAIREEVMRYFKGTCVERLTEHNNISRSPIQVGRLQYQYQRIDNERQNPQCIYLADLPIMGLRKLPDRLTLNVNILKASPGLKKLRENLESFLKNYLVAVKVETDKTVFKGRVKSDEQLFTAVPRVSGNEGENFVYSPSNTTWVSADWSIGSAQEYVATYLTNDMPF